MLKIAAIAAKLALTAFLVWLAFSKIDLASAWATLRSVSYLALLAAAVMFAIQFCLAAVRLRQILGSLGAPYRFRSALAVVLIGVFFSQTFISFLGGDAMRIWKIVRSQVSVPVAAKSVLFDRIAGFAGLFVLLLVATPMLIDVIKSPEMLAGQVLIVLGALGGIAASFALRRVRGPIAAWKPVHLAKSVVDNGLQIWRSPSGVRTLLGLSIAVQFMNVLILHAMAMGLGLQLRFIDGFLLFPTVLFLAMLPISFAGWGVREGAMVAGLSLVGIPPHQSLALSVCFGLSAIVASLPGGLVWLAGRHPQIAAEGDPVRLP